MLPGTTTRSKNFAADGGAIRSASFGIGSRANSACSRSDSAIIRHNIASRSIRPIVETSIAYAAARARGVIDSERSAGVRWRSAVSATRRIAQSRSVIAAAAVVKSPLSSATSGGGRSFTGSGESTNVVG